jgi:multidrug resistance efflux pump
MSRRILLLCLLLLPPAVARGAETAHPERAPAGTLSDGAPAVVFAPRREALLSAEVAGRVVEVRREMGGAFEAGEVLLRIDETLHAAAVGRARAALEAAEAVLRREETLAEQRTDLRRAEALVRAAAAELEATEGMYADRSVSRVELEAARSALAVARADAERVRTGAGARLAEARRDREAAAALRAEAEERLAACTLRAPFAGRVAEVRVREHESIRPGAPLLRIVSDETLLAKCLVPAREADRVREGRSVAVRVEETGALVSGVVRRVSPILDPASGTVEIHAIIENPDGRLRPGMNGRLLPSAVAGAAPGGAHEQDG